MALARKIATLGHQARNQAQIKVRQPLSRILVKSTLTLSDAVASLVRAELNVVGVEVSDSLEGAYAEAPVPNFRTLGPRLGGGMQPVADWIKRKPAAEMRSLLESGTATVDIDGSQVELKSEDVIYDSVLPEGFAKAEDAGIELLLDCRIDDALREKGLLREVVHRIQMGRKMADFEVTDRVTLWYDGEGDLADVIAANEAEVAAEILATHVVRGQISDEAEYTETLELDEGRLRIGLRRAAGQGE